MAAFLHKLQPEGTKAVMAMSVEAGHVVEDLAAVIQNIALQDQPRSSHCQDVLAVCRAGILSI